MKSPPLTSSATPLMYDASSDARKASAAACSSGCEMRESLRALRAAGAQIFFGHDPEFWESVPQAPASIL